MTSGAAPRKRCRRRWVSVCPSMLALLAVPGVWAASEEAHHGEGHGIPWTLLAFTAVNFALFVYVVFVRGILPSLRTYARDRRDRVVRELEEAARMRSEAERLREEWERRVANLDEEVAEIRRQAAADAAHERDRILENARKVAAAIEEDARRAVDHEIARAETSLRVHVGREALAIAERLLREQITADDQRRFVDEFLRQVQP